MPTPDVELLPGLLVPAEVAPLVTCPKCHQLVTSRGSWWGCPVGHTPLIDQGSLVRDIIAAVLGVRRQRHQWTDDERRIEAAANDLLDIMDAVRRSEPPRPFTM